MVGLNISAKVTLMPLAMAAMFFTIPIRPLQYNNGVEPGLDGHVIEPFFQQIVMMLGVTGDDVCHCAHGYGSAISHSRALPDVRRKRLKERHSRVTDSLKLIQQFAQLARV